MDILISSNLERLLYELSDQNENLVKSMMKQLEGESKQYTITPKMKERLKGFYGGFTIEEKDEFKLIERLSERTGLTIPEPIKDLAQKPVLHDIKCEKDKMKDTVKEILDI
jgi:hypothetical protein